MVITIRDFVDILKISVSVCGVLQVSRASHRYYGITPGFTSASRGQVGAAAPMI